MKRYILLICAALCLGSCGDFLKEYSQELTYATSCKDLSELLIGGGYMKFQGLSGNFTSKSDGYYMPWIHVMDDDIREMVLGYNDGTMGSLQKLAGFHRWEPQPFHQNGVPYVDQDWYRFYEHIAVLNVILDKVKEFADDPIEDQLQVKGESYFLRAAYYFLLVNIYAKPYAEATAASTPGVPLKLVPQIEDQNFRRASVKQVYDRIVADLLESVKCFEGVPARSMHRANEAAALALLARVYCYMGEWDAVPELCDKVLKNTKYSLLDLNTHDPAKHFTDQNSPEIIFTMGGYAWGHISEDLKYPIRPVNTFTLSDEVQYRLYREEDLRPAAFFTNASTYFPGDPTYLRPAKYKPNDSRGKPVSDNYLIRLAEVYLNKAEALAMTGDDAQAADVLHELMAKRFKPADLETVSLSGEVLVNFIRAERRRELCFEGHRWFDLRRYAVSPKYPFEKEIWHDYYVHDNSPGSVAPGQIGGYYRLGKYSNDQGGYVLPIPDGEIEMNEGELVNDERPDRPLNKL